jgi:hypothetical protein
VLSLIAAPPVQSHMTHTLNLRGEGKRNEERGTRRAEAAYDDDGLDAVAHGCAKALNLRSHNLSLSLSVSLSLCSYLSLGLSNLNSLFLPPSLPPSLAHGRLFPPSLPSRVPLSLPSPHPLLLSLSLRGEETSWCAEEAQQEENRKTTEGIPLQGSAGLHLSTRENQEVHCAGDCGTARTRYWSTREVQEICPRISPVTPAHG